MTAKDFVIKIINLYGDFKSKGMADEFFNTVSKFNDSQRDSLYQIYIKKIPGNYTPDLRSLLECIDSLGLKVEKQVNYCKCCGMNIEQNNYCNSCGYSDDKDLQEYKSWLSRNQDELVFMLNNLMTDLAKKNQQKIEG